MLNRLELEIIGGLLLIAAFTGLWFHHDSTQQAKGYAACEAKVSETQSQAAERDAALTSRYEQQVQDATEAVSKIPLATAVHTPVWLQVPGEVCAGAAASVPKADDVHTDAPGDGGRPGQRNIRPGLEAFKVRYGNTLKACQLDLDEWPPTEIDNDTTKH